jgi:nucleotide-binding universal stress UspA family protein
MTLPRTILVPTDFSEHADHALEYAAKLAATLDATICLVHAITIPAMSVPEMGMAYSALSIKAMTEHAQSELDKRVAGYRDRVTLAPTRLDVAAEQIDADLIIMGTHGRRGIRRMLLGSVAESVVRTARCPVLTIRPKRP